MSFLSERTKRKKVTSCDGMFTYYEDEKDGKTELIDEIKSMVNTEVSEEEMAKMRKMAIKMIHERQNSAKGNQEKPKSLTKNKTSGSLLDTAGNVISGTLDIAAGVVGLAAYGVATAGKAAIDGASTLYDTTKNDIQMFNDDKAKNEKNQKRLSDAQQLYADSYHILEYEATQLDDLIKRLKSQVSRLTEYYSKDTSSLSIAQNKISTADETNISASFAGAMGAGTLAAGSTLGLVAAFGTAGTGAAISSLSGTYAASATLAWLGGGTLASGGAGIAGGVAVSAALFAVPALAVGGVLAHNKVQEFHEKVKKATAAVDKAININKKLTARNYEAAERIRTISEVGIAILFFLRDLNYRQQYVKGDNLVKMKQISGAAKEKLFETYLQIKPLDDENNAENHIMDTLEAIEDECADLQRILDYDDVTLYNSRTFEDAFHKIFEDAKEYVWISYPDYRNWCIDRDIKYMRSAIKRGVKLVVFYGLKGDTSNPRYKSNSDKKAKLNSDAIQYLKQQLNSQNVTIIPSDSHRKIALCEKYVLHGSHNIMSYRWKPEDQREEVTAKLNGEKTVSKFKDLLRGLSRKHSVFTEDI